MNNLKIAIYSGVIPSTTFIENLIKSVAHGNKFIYLFGTCNKQVSYNNPKIIQKPSPESGAKLILFVITNWLKLLLSSPKVWQIIKEQVNANSLNSKHKWVLWGKYLPIANNLPHIFHIQWAKGCEEWLFLKEKLGVRLIISLRGAHINYAPVVYERIKASYLKVFPYADGFHAVSRAIGAQAQEYGAKIENIQVVYSGLDFKLTDQYKKSDASKLSTPFKILSVGRSHWNKGYRYAIDAIHTIHSQGSDIHYTIVADGYPEELLYQIKDYGIEGIVTILPNKKQSELFEIMKSSDLLLLPSLAEGIANVALEAMAIGLPVLSSDCEGMKEAISDGETGYLFKSYDVTDLISKLNSILVESTDHKQKISSNARNYVSTRHSISSLQDGMSSLYQQVMNSKTVL